MYRKYSKKRETVKLISIYIIMSLAVICMVTFTVLFMVGYRFNVDEGSVEQFAFLQFNSTPAGATVSVDGKEIGPRTPSKYLVRAGKHDISMSREGYESWSRSIEVSSGVIYWLNYALLVPKVLTPELVLNYESVYSSIASPDKRSILVQEYANPPVFTLVDISADAVKSVKLTIPGIVYSESTNTDIVHIFNAVKWDNGGRYVLVKHNFGDKNEWLVLDTQNIELSKNITRTFNVAINDINFFGVSGNLFYILDSKDLRKLNLSAGTISRPFVSDVNNFKVYDKSNIITYTGNIDPITKETVVGLYRDGDEIPYVIKTIINDKNTPIHIAYSHYYNENYVVIIDGKKVDILSGNYPNVVSDNISNLKNYTSFDLKNDVKTVSLSPSGQYIIMQSDNNFESYNLEYKNLVSYNVQHEGEIKPLTWLNDSYLWSDYGGELIVREFDGKNVHSINKLLTGQGVTLTHNGRYIYSINKVDTGYQLNRVRMTLP